MAAWIPNAVDRTMVGKSSTTSTSKAFHAETDTAANTHENATTCDGEGKEVSEWMSDRDTSAAKGERDTTHFPLAKMVN